MEMRLGENCDARSGIAVREVRQRDYVNRKDQQ
jgi:hypothetical protein